jgi:NADPH2:quinone reductase
MAVGDRVAYTMLLGTYAEYQAVPAARVVALPAHVDFRSAAAVMLQGTTAHYLTHSTFPLAPGDTALVHAGAGGVGQLIIQAGAQARRARDRDGGHRGQSRARRARRRRARYHLHAAGLRSRGQAPHRWTGVDVVYDSVGKDTFDKSLNCLRPRGVLALFGFSSGAVAPFDPRVLGAKGSLFLTRPGLNQYISRRADELLGRTRDLFAWIGAGELTLNVGATYPLSETATAHTELEARRTTGKLLLEIGVS